LPAHALGQTVFKRDADERGDDPTWIVQGIYERPPDIKSLSVTLDVLSAARNHGSYRLMLQEIPATGWLQKNQESYVPIRAGRIVIHSHKDKSSVAAHQRGIELPVGAAFGTGEHPTTFGCLMALQRAGVLRRGMRVLDVGTGSGILAFAAARLARVKVLGGDNDAESVTIARENIRRNGLCRFVRMEKAEGFRNRRIARQKPYALVVSNIFARPLARLAPGMRRHLAQGGRVILAGFLHRDANRVKNAYAAQRIHLEHRLNCGAWAILTLRRPCRETKVTRSVIPAPAFAKATAGLLREPIRRSSKSVGGKAGIHRK
ncbi:MAG: 50S ribosomal protein L11 methyltransferase, partial [Proteobacteria bacterium]|nr:50S ribosomal protein L11 methyltransferase [Pseudomonadota bacterium]